MLNVSGPIRPDEFWRQDAERWTAAQRDQDAWREGMAMAKEEAAKERPVSQAGEERPARRRRTPST